MSFVEGLELKYKQIMDQCSVEPFVQEMGEGTLPDLKFGNYIVQSSIFLRSYVRSHGYGLAKSRTLREMKRFYTMIGYVDDSENITRLDYLRQLGMTDEDVDKTPMKVECQQYCEFIENNAAKGDTVSIVMAGLPYLLMNQYVFTELKKNRPDVMKGKYASLVNEYTSQSYMDFCESWTSYANSICEGSDEERMKTLEEIFKQAMFHELYFWQMAGRDEME